MRGPGRAAAGLLLLPVLLFAGAAAAAAQELFVRLLLNGEDKGEVLARLEPSGDFLLREADLRAAGFREVPGRVEAVGGEPHVFLSSLPGVRFSFDERRLTLSIEAPPALLPRRTIDFLPGRRPNVLYPGEPAGFLNYGFSYAAGDGLSFASFNATGQAGARAGDWLLLTDAAYTKTPAEASFVRLMTSLIRDRRQTLQRLVLGDAVASSGDLGASVNMGGVSFSKVYAMDPYFIRYPAAGLTGFLPTASEVQVYVDGTRIRTERLPPGEFELRNIVDYGGAGTVTVVIRDAFGREERILYPFYFTDVLLREGLHEYEYHAGALREGFGESSARYGKAAFSFLHRYGWRDGLNVGVRGEGSTDRANAGPLVVWRAGTAGIVTASASASARGGEWGAAGLLRYVYQDRRRNARLSWRGFSSRYALLGAEDGAEAIRREIEAGAGWGFAALGTLSADVTDLRRAGRPARRTLAVSWSRSLRRRASLLASWRRTREEGSATEWFAGVTYQLGPDRSLAASWRGEGSAGTQTLQVQKSAPTGEGVGYRLAAERSEVGGAAAWAANPFLQYNARRAVLTGEYRVQAVEGGQTAESGRAALSGGIAWVDGEFGLSRPIADSFGLAVVDDLEGVRVFVNNQEAGRTDRRGRLFLPALHSYYENYVRVDDRDIPIDYVLRDVAKVVSPPLRSGSVVRFEARRLQAVTGRLLLWREGKEVPLEFREGTLEAPRGPVVFPTGKGGEFYLEDVPPGAHRGRVEYNGTRCGFELVVPPSAEVVVDAGQVLCEESP